MEYSKRAKWSHARRFFSNILFMVHEVLNAIKQDCSNISFCILSIWLINCWVKMWELALVSIVTWSESSLVLTETGFRYYIISISVTLFGIFLTVCIMKHKKHSVSTHNSNKWHSSFWGQMCAMVPIVKTGDTFSTAKANMFA